MSAAAPEPEIPLSVRVGFAVGSTLLALVLSEGVVRVADGGALPTLGLFATAEDGAITLRAGASARLTRPDGTVYTIITDADGVRAEPAAGRWLAPSGRRAALAASFAVMIRGGPAAARRREAALSLPSRPGSSSPCLACARLPQPPAPPPACRLVAALGPR